jgi:membrane protein required for colicin V production
MVFDIIFIILFVWAAYKGYTKGFILQIASLAALIIGIYGAIKFSSLLTTFLLKEYNITQEYLPIISFALIFISIVLLIYLLAKLLEKMADLTALGFINRLFGAIFNMIKYALIISIFLVIINNINRKSEFLPEKQMQSSFFYYPLSVLSPLIYPYLRYNFLPLKEKSEPINNEITV